jgi:ABC-type transport system involved in multi-copper enzyme maturation permease subunit
MKILFERSQSMILLTLLHKELRTRLRRERIVWLMVIYILLLGMAGWVVLSSQNNAPLYTMGTTLYYLLANLQLGLLILIIPAFTATAINGEKEHQTYDLLLCSQLSNFALITGKMLAGMATALLLIAASLPTFSLIFFFGGVGPAQLIEALLIYLATALLVGSVGMLCSILFQRPAVSTALAYVFNLLWCLTPYFLMFGWYYLFSPQGLNAIQTNYLLLWSPFAAMVSVAAPSSLPLSLGHGMSVSLWVAYLVTAIALAALFFVTSIFLVRPILPTYGVSLREQPRTIKKVKAPAH